MWRKFTKLASQILSCAHPSLGWNESWGNQFQWRWHRCQIRETTEDGAAAQWTWALVRLRNRMKQRSKVHSSTLWLMITKLNTRTNPCLLWDRCVLSKVVKFSSCRANKGGVYFDCISPSEPCLGQISLQTGQSSNALWGGTEKSSVRWDRPERNRVSAPQ